MSNKNKTLKARVNETQKAKMDALARTVFGSSTSGAIRTLIDEVYHEYLGEIDPQVLEENRLSEEQLRGLLDGSLDPSDLPDEYLVSEDDDSEARDRPLKLSDGGTVPLPDSYEGSLPPQKLRSAGPTLSWSDLRKLVGTAVDEVGPWGEDLELHPDRVGPTVMKSNHVVVPRVLAAIIRHEANDEMLPVDEVEEIVRHRVAHLSNKGEPSHVVSTYLEKTLNELYLQPSPKRAVVFTSRDRYVEAVREIVSERARDLVNAGNVIDQATVREIIHGGKKPPRGWTETVADLLEGAARFLSINFDGIVEEEDLADLEEYLPESGSQFIDSLHMIASLGRETIRLYHDSVPQKAMPDIESALLDQAGEAFVDAVSS